MRREQYAQDARHEQSTEHCNGGPVDVAAHAPRFDTRGQQAVGAQVLPVLTDHVRRSSALGGRQVSGPRREALLVSRQAGVTSARRSAGISGRSWARPGGHGALGGVQGESPLGVDSLDRGPRYVHGAEDVAHRHLVFGDVQTGKPEHRESARAEQRQGPAVAHESQPVAGDHKAGEAGDGHNYNDHTQYPAEGRTETRRGEAHSPSFADRTGEVPQ